MTLRSIILKNIKGNLNKFIMYYLSNAFVVMVFFIFANFIYSPNIKNVKTMGQMGAIMSNIMLLCEFVIVVFTLVFTNYSISSFLKSREKEFGLLSMFGFTKSEIRKYVMLENLIVSLLSILTGLLLGILFSKLFFMAVSAILALDSELTLTISFKALALTIACFLVLFQGMGFIVSHKIKNNNIIQLLKGARIAKPVPEFSKKKAILSIVLIVAGYLMAAFSYQAIVFTMFPILGLTVWGTYLLYSQFSVYFTNKLQNNKNFFYKGLNMVALSQMIYKLSDNAKILFAVSILSAVTLTSSASVYSFQKAIENDTILNSPHDVSFIERGINTHKVIMPKKAEKVFDKYGNEIEYKNKVILINGTSTSPFKNKAFKYNNGDSKDQFYIMSNADYNSLAKQQKKPVFSLKKGEAIIYSHSFEGNKSVKTSEDNEHLELKVDDKSLKYNIIEEAAGTVINADEINTNTIVVNDKEFGLLKSKISGEEFSVYYSYNIKNWMKAEKAVSELKNEIPKEMKAQFTERVISFSSNMKGMSIFFFIGTFIAILFFIATGSILYFKLFNEIQKDRQEFISLKKIGISGTEVKKIVSFQCLIIFFLPFVIGVSHTSFAIAALSNMLQASLSLYLMIIVGIYLLLQIIYFSFAKAMYVKQINSWQ
ncbi:ABC transporter permease [Clostridium neuense]|uniref:ABC transporter permease n=1 Tax=Clostridium neuense TaxID=1728934 RepID=A0ABW8T8Z6_9CLOT